MSPSKPRRPRLPWLVLDLTVTPPVLRCRHCDETAAVPTAPDGVSVALATLSDASVAFVVAHDHQEQRVAGG